MFYLIAFYKILSKTPLKSLIFVTMSWGIVLSFAQNRALNKLLFKELPDERDYFYALISDKKNRNDISRKLQNLPGIDFIRVVPREAIQKELVKILKHSRLAQYMDASFEGLDYQGLKIIFSSNVKTESQNLIRDYLFRLVGKEDLTLGPIEKRSSLALNKKQPFIFFKKYGVLFLIAIGTLIWVFIGLSYIGSFQDSSYVIENFQRRRGVSFKIALSGMVSLFFTGLFFAQVSGRADGKGVLMAILPFLFMVILYTRTKEWRH